MTEQFDKLRVDAEPLLALLDTSVAATVADTEALHARAASAMRTAGRTSTGTFVVAALLLAVLGAFIVVSIRRTLRILADQSLQR